jgi:nicotinamidase-related amidase
MRDYLADYPTTFTLEPSKTALVIIDMQYASASRMAGLGTLLERQGLQDSGSYRFDRIEQVVVPSIQKLLAFFRKNNLQILYLTVGTEAPDYRDLPRHMRAFQMAVGNTQESRERRILEELTPRPGEYILNKTTAGAFNSTGIEHRLPIP